jgi:ABC-2 type transport system ATP-binding protein
MFAEQGLDAAGAARFRAQWYDTWDADYYEELMVLFQVPKYTLFKQLSHGEQRKFQLVAALATRPRLLILDEPSSGYDPFAWAQMIDVLQAYLASGDGDITIVIASHNMEEVRRLADYVVLLDQGRMLGMAEKDALAGSWRECWFQLRGTLPADLPGVVYAEETRPGYYSVISSEWQAVAHDLRSYGVEDIQFRQLEAEEALKLWLEGHQPPLASV